MYSNTSNMPPKRAEGVEVRRLMTAEEISKRARSLPEEEGVRFVLNLSEEEKKMYFDYVDKETDRVMKETDRINKETDRINKETDEFIKYAEEEIKKLEDFAGEMGRFISNF